MPSSPHVVFGGPLRSKSIGAAGALMLLLTPALALAQGDSAQSSAARSGDTGQNITAQVQSHVSVNLPSLNPLVQRVLPAVVNISAELSSKAAVESDQPAEGRGSDEPYGPFDRFPKSPFDQFLKRFFENRGLPQMYSKAIALGSGFIIDPSGYVVTNNHVVGNAEKITVILQDNSRHPAKVIGRDEKTDLALLKIDTGGQKLPFVSWGDSDNAKVGDWVMAVGNPFGLGGTVTAGIVSALGRNINEGPYDDFIQIDAPINRGNSGGPTFNLNGEVIGINTAIYSPSGGSVGIGFAVPSNTAKNVIDQIREHGHVTRGWLGVAIQEITPTIAKGLGMNSEQPMGTLVASVTPDSPAAKAGLKPGDVILNAEGHEIKTVHDLPRLVANAPIGQRLNLQVRRNAKEMMISPTITELKENQEQQAAANENARPLGLQLSAIDPAKHREFQIPGDVEGAVVTNVAPDSPAAALGIEPGDVIQSVDQQPVTTPQEAAQALQKASTKENILLLLNRHGTSQFVGLSVNPGELGNENPG